MKKRKETFESPDDFESAILVHEPLPVISLYKKPISMKDSLAFHIWVYLLKAANEDVISREQMEITFNISSQVLDEKLNILTNHKLISIDDAVLQIDCGENYRDI